jgi:ankyrin repeat protein
LIHPAAVNGHTDIVRALLLHGAHADRADKHGVTPEVLARDNRIEGKADIE